MDNVKQLRTFAKFAPGDAMKACMEASASEIVIQRAEIKRLQGLLSKLQLDGKPNRAQRRLPRTSP